MSLLCRKCEDSQFLNLLNYNVITCGQLYSHTRTQLLCEYIIVLVDNFWNDKQNIYLLKKTLYDLYNYFM